MQVQISPQNNIKDTSVYKTSKASRKTASGDESNLNQQDFFSYLLYSKVIDETGICQSTELLPELPEIGNAIILEIDQLLNQAWSKEFHLSQERKVCIDFTLRELLLFLVTSHGVKIEEIELYGSTVPWLLKKTGYLLEIFKSLNYHGNSDRVIEAFDKNPTDVDIRMRMPTAGVSEITSLRDRVVDFFCIKTNAVLQHFGLYFYQNDRLTIINHGFSKFTSPSDTRLSSVLGIGNVHCKGPFKGFDILIEQDNKRKCMMSLDSLRIPIQEILIKGIACVKTQLVTDYTTGPWQPILDRLCRISRAENLETLDPIAIARAFSDSLLGFLMISKKLESALMDKVIEAIGNTYLHHLLPRFPSELQSAHLDEKIAFVLSTWFKKATESHLDQFSHAPLLITLKSCQVLKTHEFNPEKGIAAPYTKTGVIKQLWKKMQERSSSERPLNDRRSISLIPIDNRSLHPVLAALQSALMQDVTLYDSFLALIEIKTFLHACTNQTNEDERMSLTTLHGHFDLKIDGIHLFFLIDPVKAFARLFEGLKLEKNRELFAQIDRSFPRLNAFSKDPNTLINRILIGENGKNLLEAMSKGIRETLQKENDPIYSRLCCEICLAMNCLGVDSISYNRLEPFIPKIFEPIETLEEKLVLIEDIQTCKMQPAEIYIFQEFKEVLKTLKYPVALLWTSINLKKEDDACITAAFHICKNEIIPSRLDVEAYPILYAICWKIASHRLDLFAKLLLEWVNKDCPHEMTLQAFSYIEKSLTENRNRNIDKPKALLHLLQLLGIFAEKSKTSNKQCFKGFISVVDKIISTSIINETLIDEIIKCCRKLDSKIFFENEWDESKLIKATWIVQIMVKNQWNNCFQLWSSLFKFSNEAGALDVLEQILKAITTQPAKMQTKELTDICLQFIQHNLFEQFFILRKDTALPLYERLISLVNNWRKENLTSELINALSLCPTDGMLAYAAYYLTQKEHSLKPELRQWILKNWLFITRALATESPSLCLAFIQNATTIQKIEWNTSEISLDVLHTLLSSSLSTSDKRKAHLLYKQVREQLREKKDDKEVGEIKLIIKCLLKDHLYAEAKEWLALHNLSDSLISDFETAIIAADESKMDLVFDLMKELSFTDLKTSQVVANAFKCKLELTGENGNKLTACLQISYADKKLPIKLAWIRALAYSRIKAKCEASYHLVNHLVGDLKFKNEANDLLKELLIDLIVELRFKHPLITVKLIAKAYPGFIDFTFAARTLTEIKPNEECLPLLREIVLKFSELDESPAPEGFAELLHLLINTKEKLYLLKLQELVNPHFLSKRDWEYSLECYPKWMSNWKLENELIEAGRFWNSWQKHLSPNQDKTHLKNWFSNLMNALFSQIDKGGSRELFEHYLQLLQTPAGLEWLEENVDSYKKLLGLIERSISIKKPLIEESLSLISHALKQQQASKLGVLCFFKILDSKKVEHTQLKPWVETNQKALQIALIHAEAKIYPFVELLHKFDLSLDLELEKLIVQLYQVAHSFTKEQCVKAHAQTIDIRSDLVSKSHSDAIESAILDFCKLFLKQGLFNEANDWAFLLKSKEYNFSLIQTIFNYLQSNASAELLLINFKSEEEAIYEYLTSRLLEFIFNSNIPIENRCKLLKILRLPLNYHHSIKNYLLQNPSSSLGELNKLSTSIQDKESKTFLFSLAADLFPFCSKEDILHWIITVPLLLDQNETRPLLRQTIESAFQELIHHSLPNQVCCYHLMRIANFLQINSTLECAEANFCCSLMTQNQTGASLLEIHSLIKSKFFVQSIQKASYEVKWNSYFSFIEQLIECHLRDQANEILLLLAEIYQKKTDREQVHAEKMEKWLIFWKDDPFSLDLIKTRLEVKESIALQEYKDEFYKSDTIFDLRKHQFSQLVDYIPNQALSDFVGRSLDHMMRAPFIDAWSLLSTLTFIKKIETCPIGYLIAYNECMRRASRDIRIYFLERQWKDFWMMRKKYNFAEYSDVCIQLFQNYRSTDHFEYIMKDFNEISEFIYSNRNFEHSSKIAESLFSCLARSSLKSYENSICELSDFGALFFGPKQLDYHLHMLVINCNAKPTSTPELCSAYEERISQFYQSCNKNSIKELENITSSYLLLLKEIPSLKLAAPLIPFFVKYYLMHILLLKLDKSEQIIEAKIACANNFLKEVLSISKEGIFLLNSSSALRLVDFLLNQNKPHANMIACNFIHLILEATVDGRESLALQSKTPFVFQHETKQICRFSRLNDNPVYAECIKMIFFIRTKIHFEDAYNISFVSAFDLRVIQFIYKSYAKLGGESDIDNKHLFAFSLFLQIANAKKESLLSREYLERKLDKNEYGPEDELLGLVSNFALIISTWFRYSKNHPPSPQDYLKMMPLLDELLFFTPHSKTSLTSIIASEANFSEILKEEFQTNRIHIDEKRMIQYSLFFSLPHPPIDTFSAEMRVEAIREVVIRSIRSQHPYSFTKAMLILIKNLDPKDDPKKEMFSWFEKETDVNLAHSIIDTWQQILITMLQELEASSIKSLLLEYLEKLTQALFIDLRLLYALRSSTQEKRDLLKQDIWKKTVLTLPQNPSLLIMLQLLLKEYCKNNYISRPELVNKLDQLFEILHSSNIGKNLGQFASNLHALIEKLPVSEELAALLRNRFADNLTNIKNPPDNIKKILKKLRGN